MDAQGTREELLQELTALRARVAELEGRGCSPSDDGRSPAETEQLYRRLVETSPDSIVLTDIEGRVLVANRQTAKLHRFADASELVGLNVLDIVPEEGREEASAVIRRILETGEVQDSHHLLLRKDESCFMAEVTGTLVRDADGKPKYIIYNGRDVTARLRMQQELVESQKLESVGRLAGGIAHDFNNLLAVVLGNASLQLRNRELPPKTIECLKDIVEAAERASALTTQLLAYARGGLRRPVPAELNKLVQAACDILRPTLPRQIQLNLELAENPPVVVVDRSQIQQVIINLAMNAIQATSAPGEVTVRTAAETIDAGAAERLQLPAGEYAIVQVVDQGDGMDRPTAERAFEPFFTTKAESRGMGLPASLGIIEGHHGRIALDSKPGGGTVASVWLPGAGAGSADQAPEVAPRMMNAPQGSETVLVIEPEPAVGHTAEQILASLGYCVVTHNEADRALAFLKTNCEDVDLVVLNASMPAPAGPSMLEEIRAGCPTMPVLLASGYDQSAEADRLRAMGAAGFVGKPFTLMSLAQAVRGVLDDPSRPKRYSVYDP